MQLEMNDCLGVNTDGPGLGLQELNEGLTIPTWLPRSSRYILKKIEFYKIHSSSQTLNIYFYNNSIFTTTKFQ